MDGFGGGRPATPVSREPTRDPHRLVRTVLAGKDLVDATSVVSIDRSAPQGHVAAV